MSFLFTTFFRTATKALQGFSVAPRASVLFRRYHSTSTRLPPRPFHKHEVSKAYATLNPSPYQKWIRQFEGSRIAIGKAELDEQQLEFLAQSYRFNSAEALKAIRAYKAKKLKDIESAAQELKKYTTG